MRDVHAGTGALALAWCRRFGHVPFLMRYGRPPLEYYQEMCERCYVLLGPTVNPSDEQWAAHIAAIDAGALPLTERLP